MLDEPHILKQSLTKKGRPEIRIRCDSKRRTLRIHIIVLETFVGPRPHGLQACHHDDNPLNNHVSNLRWDTHASNVADGIRNGTVAKGERAGKSKLTKIQVLEIRDRYANGESSTALGDEFGVAANSVRAITSGKSWRHVGGPRTFDERVSGNHYIGGGRRISDDRIPEILRRRSNGEAFKSIAKDFGVSDTTIRNYVRKNT